MIRHPSRSGGFYGACVTSQSCLNSSSGYSRTCGVSGLICCKGSTPFRRRNQERPVPGSPRRKTTTTPSPSTPGPAEEGEKCGLSSIALNILGGQEAEKGNFPWMVSLVNRWGSNICGGVLITRKHVLTAAHCFDQRDWRAGEIDVRLAQVDISQRELAGTEASISLVKIHERWERDNMKPEWSTPGPRFTLAPYWDEIPGHFLLLAVSLWNKGAYNIIDPFRAWKSLIMP